MAVSKNIVDWTYCPIIDKYVRFFEENLKNQNLNREYEFSRINYYKNFGSKKIEFLWKLENSFLLDNSNIFQKCKYQISIFFKFFKHFSFF